MRPQYRKEERIIAALLSTSTLEAAAEKAGVGVTTIKRRLQSTRVRGPLPEGTAALAGRRNQQAGCCRIRLRRNPASRSYRLRRPGRQSSGCGPERVTMAKLMSVVDFEERLARLEESAAVLNSDGGR